jgi:hypothetical protein
MSKIIKPKKMEPEIITSTGGIHDFIKEIIMDK